MSETHGVSSRRDFLRSLAVAPAALPHCRTAALPRSLNPALPQSHNSIDPFPLASTVARFRERQNDAAGWRPLSLDRREYLRLADGIVRFFAPMQDARGAIVDPYERKERQYSTPAFAAACAVLHASGYNRTLLAPCIRAFDAAVGDLAGRRTADNHSDFYTILIMQAYTALKGRVPRSKWAAWRAALAQLRPEHTYRYQPESERFHNWNLVAVAGEWRRHHEGLSDDGGDARGWIGRSLARHAGSVTAHGLYRDPNDPMAYDHFARYHLVDMLEEGFTDSGSGWREWMDRAAWTSLLMQSPHGELPCGGRSAHHQWNEAQQAATFEAQAARVARQGDLAAAGAFKRAARLSLRSVGRWRRPSGELWIAKNRADPAARHGYESYSFHSQYNLLAAAMLVNAYGRADDRIRERPCPAETGGFAFALAPAFHKVFANAGGLYLEIDTGAHLAYNPTGLLRVHHPAIGPQVAVSDGIVSQPSYKLPAKPSRNLSLGPAWRDRSGAWHALADHGGLGGPELRVSEASPRRVSFELEYRGSLRGGATVVRQRVDVTPDAFDVIDDVEGDIDAVRQEFPLPVNDGSRDYEVVIEGPVGRVSDGAGRMIVEALGEGRRMTAGEGREPSRNGYVRAAVCEATGRTARYRMRFERVSGVRSLPP